MSIKNYVQQKKTKQGMALSTVMAISIVLLILVTMLVSMATLNITTTQATIGQRDAYIQAKSAIAFAESYYISHDDEIPGVSSNYGEALMVFHDKQVYNGASVYITKEGTTEKVSADDIEKIKDASSGTYLEVINTGAELQLMATSYYNESSAYALTKEIKLTANDSRVGNAFNGTIKYDIGSETRYLRIHVRPKTVNQFTNLTLYSWGFDVNSPSASGKAPGTSSVVNHLTNSSENNNSSNSKILNPSGFWIYGGGMDEPSGVMTYEGNGWYLYTMEFSSTVNVNTVNFIVHSAGTVRSSGYNSQSWEFYGLPVPKLTGAANGADVYITLNKDYLQDAKQGSDNLGLAELSGSHTDFDDSSRWYQNLGNTPKNFASFASRYYSVYTKHEETIIHYRHSGDTDGSKFGGGSGWDYEGYGWYRTTADSLSGSVSIGSDSFGYGGHIVSQNAYGRETVQEMFIVTNSMGENKAFDYESDANAWLISEGDATAADYVTIYAKGDQQDISAPKNTEITYTYTKAAGGSSTPTPPTGTLSSNSGEAPVAVSAALTKGYKTPTASAMAYVPEASGDSFGAFDSENNRRIYYRATVDRNDDTREWDATGGYTLTYAGTSVEMIQVDCTNPNGIYKSDYFYADVPNTITSVTINPNDGNGDHYVDITLPDGESIVFAEDTSVISGGKTVYYLNKSNRIDTTPCINEYGDSWQLAMDSGSYFGTPMVNLEGNLWWAHVPTLSNNIKISKWEDGSASITAYLDYASENMVISVDDSGNPTVMTLEEARNYGGSGYRIVGTTNLSTGWTHNFDDAVPMISLDGGLTYYYTYSALPAGSYRLKVISEEARLDTPDEEGKTINYDYSWGTEYGSGSPDFTFVLNSQSKVTVTITVNEGGSSSQVTYAHESFGGPNVTWTTVGFYNNKLEHMTDSTQTTEFTTPWSEVWVTYVLNGSTSCAKIGDEGIDGDFYWAKDSMALVPKEAEYIYFSNMNSQLPDLPADAYQRTENIPKTKYESSVNAIFFPKKKTQQVDGVYWSFGDSAEYRIYTTNITEDHRTDTMVYTGSNMNAYYNVPVVDLLDALTNSTGRMYSNICWSGGYNYLGKNYTFSTSAKVTYQGEEYYYSTNTNGGHSFLLCKNGDSINRYGALYKGQFAFSAGNTTNISTGDPMNNRAGAVFTSSGEYYNGGNSNGLDYGGYVPNWYTVKIPVVSYFKVESMSGGLKRDGSTVDVNTGKIDLVPAQVNGVSVGDTLKQPVYFYYTNDNNKLGMYTYDVSAQSVDTSKDNKVSVYFSNTEGWSNPHVYAVNMNGGSEKSLTLDASDEDNNFYKFTFNAGEYAYFIFHEGNDVNNTANKSSEYVYFTGNEDFNTRECQILAVGSEPVMEYYLHPGTRAVYAMKEAQAAYYASFIDDKNMIAIKDAYNNAKNYAETRSSWSISGCSSYEELAAAARRLVGDIHQARIFISGECGNPTYTEGSLRDPNVTYTNRWVQSLSDAHATAMTVYNTPSAQHTANLNMLADRIEAVLNAPEITMGPDDVIIFVNDSEGWGKNNIHLWNKSGSTWLETTSLTLQDTSQTGYYAYTFRNPSGEYAITNGGEPDTTNADATLRDDTVALMGAAKYFFNTHTKKWEIDNSTPAIRVTDNLIQQGGAGDYWHLNETPMAGKEFILYFKYDTTVKYGIGGTKSYKVYAGAYTINSAYSGWSTDAGTGRNGIDLFTDTAKAYLTDPARYGMSTAMTYSPWNADITKGNTAADIMCDSITGNFTAQSNKRVNFRYKNEMGSDTLNLSQQVRLKAPVVYMAVNNINLQSGSQFKIETQSVTFLTDTVVKVGGTEYTITRGTWVFVASGVGAVAEIDLSDKDWMSRYQLVSSSNSNMSGGTYVRNN
ncbi:MAG: hypothetical protein K2M82_07425 [Lachnospiraceae bacterium]|nr:hypothetical protein [Lachnospiraceae bacterium]